MKKVINKVLAMLMVITCLFCSINICEIVSLANTSQEGTEDNPYVITTVEELKNINNDLSAHYVLGCDLYLGTSSWIPIGTPREPFSGKFSGDGHTIYGVNGFDNSYQYRGLFGYATESSVIEFLCVEMDEDVSYTIKAGSVKVSTGMIVGYTRGTINYCSANGRLVAEGYSQSESGPWQTGLICGYSDGAISCCKADGYASSRYGGSLTYGYAYVGGIVGNGKHTVSNSYANVELSVYSGGGARPFPYAGGISGSYEATISRCYAFSYISSFNTQPKVSGLAPGGSLGQEPNPIIGTSFYYLTSRIREYQTNNMIEKTSMNVENYDDFNKISTYVGWDFTNIWMMGENNLPELKYFKQLEIQDLCLLASSPQNGELEVPTTTDLVLYFSKNISVDEAEIHLYKSSNDTEIVTEKSVVGKKLTIIPKEVLDYNTSYYLIIGEKAIGTEDRTEFFEGIKDKNDFSFISFKNIEFEAGKYVSWVNREGVWKKINDIAALKWIFSKNETVDVKEDKYYIPGINSEEYINELKYWAEVYGINDVKDSNELEQVIHTTVELPVKQMNSNSVFLTEMEDTELIDIMRDVIFIEKMQFLLSEADNKLKSAKDLAEIAEAYNKYNEYSEYVSLYLEERNGEKNSLYITTVLPFLYNAFLCSTEDGKGYKLAQTFYKTSALELQVQNTVKGVLGAYTYEEYKNAAKVAKDAFKAGKTIYTAYFKPKYKYLDNGTIVLDKTSVIKLGTDYLINVASNNCKKGSWIEKVTTAYSDFSKVYSASSLCMTLGSTIGMSSLVIQLYNDMYTKVEDEIKAFYFISDYYIYENYPALYELCFNEDFFPRDEMVVAGLSGGFEEYVYLFGNSEQIKQFDCVDSDEILSKWVQLIDKRICTEKYIRKSVVGLRRELSSYSNFCAYIQSVDTSELKLDIVKYASSIINNEETTTIMVACPVTVNVYDKTNGSMVMSVNSNTEIVNDMTDLSAYIIGENNDTKCFVMRNNKYYFEIIPFQDGDMDIIIATEEEHTQYSDIQITTENKFVLTGTENYGYEILKDNQEVLIPDNIEIVEKMYVSAPDNVCKVGENLQMSVSPIMVQEGVQWSVTDTSVGTIDENGNFSAISVGETTVVCRNTKTMETAEYTVCVFNQAIEEIDTFNISVGQYSVNELQIDGLSEFEINKINWYSNCPNIAVLNDDNKIISYQMGEAVLNGYYKNHKISIVIEVKGYTVKFVHNNGTEDLFINGIKNESVINEPVEPILAGYKFVGWYTSDKFLDSEKWEFESDVVKEDLVLYAKYEKDNFYNNENYNPEGEDNNINDNEYGNVVDPNAGQTPVAILFIGLVCVSLLSLMKWDKEELD